MFFKTKKILTVALFVTIFILLTLDRDQMKRLFNITKHNIKSTGLVPFYQRQKLVQNVHYKVKHIHIDTDAEPDDKFAFGGLFYQLEKLGETGHTLSVFVGEGKEPWRKVADVQKLLNVLNKYKTFSVINVFAGLESTKDYPYKTNCEKPTYDPVQLHYESLMHADVYYGLKPPREFFKYTEDMIQTLKLRLTVRAILAYWYGSFNFRDMKLEVEQAQWLFDFFTVVYFYESMGCVGPSPNNSGLYKPDVLTRGCMYLAKVFGLENKNSIMVESIHDWNQHIINKQREKLAKLQLEGVPTDPEKLTVYNNSLKRSTNIIEAIEPKNGPSKVSEQFVIADVGPTFAPKPTVRGRLVKGFNPDKGYPEFVVDDGSNVFVYPDDKTMPFTKEEVTKGQTERLAIIIEGINEYWSLL